LSLQKQLNKARPLIAEDIPKSIYS